MSVDPPGATGTTIRTGRTGYACARATSESAGKATMLAPNCRTPRRENFSIMCRLDILKSPSLRIGHSLQFRMNFVEHNRCGHARVMLFTDWVIAKAR